MRDLLLTLVIGCLLLAVFRYPQVGAYLWAWLSLMNPHRLTYGFARDFGFAQIAAIVTLLVLVTTRKRYPLPVTPLSVVWISFVLWMCFTSLFALNSTELVIERLIFVLKIQVMMVATIMLVRSRRHLEFLIWVVTLSIGYYGIKGGVFTVLTGGNLRVWGPGGTMVEDNNALAVALIILVPFMYYLMQGAERKLTRWFLLFAMVSCCFAILGSQSRGALVGVMAMAGALGLKSRYPVRVSLLLVVLLVTAALFMPDSWTDRMNTIQSYQGDNSAMSRVYTWMTLLNLALDRPLVGGGFRADFLPIFQTYSPKGPEYDQFQGSSWVAHSIYFQVLGEHGFMGLALFLALGVLVWRHAGRLAKMNRNDPEFGSWVPRLMAMVQAGLIGYAVGGAFLSLAYLDLPYYLVAYVLIVDGMVRAKRVNVVGMPRTRIGPEAGF